MSPENREFWQEVLRLRQESGKTVKSFCESEGIPEHRYYYWRKRFADESDTAAAGFVPVSFSNKGTTSIVVRAGCFSIEVPPGFDPGVLGRLLETVSGIQC